MQLQNELHFFYSVANTNHYSAANESICKIVFNRNAILQIFLLLYNAKSNTLQLKNNMKKNILFFVAIIIAFISCKKDNNTPVGCANTVAAIAGTYALVKVELGNAGMFTDITTVQLLPCQVDDKVELTAAGVANFKDEGTICTPPGNKTGTWGIGADGKMTLAGGSLSVNDATIVSFDCNTLVLLGTQSYAGTIIQLRLTIKK
jgi:hypothetical protein